MKKPRIVQYIYTVLYNVQICGWMIFSNSAEAVVLVTAQRLYVVLNGMRGARDDTVQRWDFKDLFGDESMTLADSRHLLTKPISSSLHRFKKNSIFAVTVEGLKGEGFKMFFYALYSFRKCKYHYKRHYTLAYLSESATACSYCISVSATMARRGIGTVKHVLGCTTIYAATFYSQRKKQQT